MSVTVNELIKLLDTEENRYGGATGRPREINLYINEKFCGSIESTKLDGYGDGLVTDVGLEIEVPKMKEYYDKEIRNKVIEEFAEELNKLFEYQSAWDKTEYHERFVVDRTKIFEIAEQMKGEI